MIREAKYWRFKTQPEFFKEKSKTNKASWEEALLFVGARSSCFGGRRGKGGWRGGSRELWAADQVSRTPHARGLLLTPAFKNNCDTVYMTKFTKLTMPMCPFQWHLARSQCQDHHHGPIPEHLPPQAGDWPPWRSASASLPARVPAFWVRTHLFWTLHTAEAHSVWPFDGAFPT